MAPEGINMNWSIDFMSDSLANGRRFQRLNVTDDCKRQSLRSEAFYSIPRIRLVQKLKELIAEQVDKWAFMFQNMNLPVKEIK